MAGTPGKRIEVSGWSDIEDTTNQMEERQKQLIKETLNRGLPDRQSLVWLPEFIRDKDLDTVKGDDRLIVCDVEDYSDDAWAATQPDTEHEPEYLPKGWAVIFEKDEECGEIESDQTGLHGWAR
jgi:hypothetical protein